MGGTWFFATCLFCFLYSSAALREPVCIVIVIRSQCFGRPSAILSQFVRNVLAIRSQCNGKPQAAVGDRFIVPANMKTPTKWGENARLW